MTSLRYTLLSDGSSDRALIPILTWAISEHLPTSAIQSEWADLRRLPRVPRGLSARIGAALELYPCDLLFVHRDAERQAAADRIAEVEAAVQALAPGIDVPVVSVVPVRMQEAWLLIDESAVRRAAGNPNGRQAVELPSLDRIESVPEPKEVLHALLRRCSGLHGRRLRRFPTSERAVRVAEFISDFAPLREVPAFAAFETHLAQLIEEKRWNEAE
jgi:hypothetical protein